MPEDTTTHSRLAPSSAAQWVPCPISLKFCEHHGLVRKGSAFSEEGTQAHEYAAALLSDKTNVLGEDVPEEFRPHIEGYNDFCYRYYQEGDQILIEESVPLFYKPEDSGTIDFALVSARRVQIVDLKYGEGVVVDAEENLQLAIYALSLVEAYSVLHAFTDDTQIGMAIYQPRTRDSSAIKTWMISLGELREFCEPITKAVGIIEKGHGTFGPSESACRWCPGKSSGKCVAHKEWLTAPLSESGINVLDDFVNLEEAIKEEETTGNPALPPHDVLTDLERLAIFRCGKQVISWINAVLDGNKEDILNHKPIEGLKVVQGRKGDRAWGDEAGAITLMKPKIMSKDLYKKKLISPTQATKLLKGKDLSTKFENRFGQLIIRPEGKPTLVLESDKRPSIVVAPEADFENLEEAAALDEAAANCL